MKRQLTIWSGGLLFAFANAPNASAQQAFPPHPVCETPINAFAQAGTILDSLADRPFVQGASMLVANRNGVVLYEHYAGSFDQHTQRRIASATKLLSGITILSLAEDGVLDLDAPMSTYLPSFSGTKGTMTIRQMFSHTSGLPGQSSVESNPDITLTQAGDLIGCCVPLAAEPGSRFFYGGVSMHAAGAAAQAASGDLWINLFNQRIAGPLELEATDYDGLGETENDRIAGGGQSTLLEFARVLHMILNEGQRLDGQQVLSAPSIEMLFTDQIGNATIEFAPSGLTDFGYSIGCWLENPDPAAADAVRLSSPGAFGFTPWIDRDADYLAIVMIDYSRGLILEELAQIQAIVRESTVQANSKPADLNQSGLVDLDDLNLVLANFGTNTWPCTSPGDADRNGIVDLDDLNLVLSRFGS